jgi:hypothetical protein
MLPQGVLDHAVFERFVGKEEKGASRDRSFDARVALSSLVVCCPWW